MKFIFSILLFVCSFVYGQPYFFVFTQVDTSGIDSRPRSFAGFNDYFDHNQSVNYPNPAITTQHSYDYYFRITANSIANGWGEFDGHINRAIDRGSKICFRIVAVDDSYSGQLVGGKILAYPLSWHNQMQGEANPDFQIGTVWWPNYNSPTFLANIALMEKMVDDHLRSTFRIVGGISWRYKECIGARDIDFIGTYGEGHTFVDGAGGTWSFPAGTFWLLSSLQNIINTQRIYVRNIPMLGNVNYFASNSRLPSGFGSWFAQEGNLWGLYGLRLDNFGNKDIYDFEFTNNNIVENSINFKNIMSTRYAVSPFLAEPIQFGFGASGQVNYYDIKRQADQLHLSICENADNIMNRLSPVPTDVQNLFRSVIKRMGYRLSFTAGQMADSIRPGNNLNMNFTALNSGIAPMYEDFELWYIFRKAGVEAFRLKSSLITRGFQPGTRAITDNITAPVGLTGDYQMYGKLLQVPDSNGKRFRKPLPLQINTVNGVASQQNDTSYFLRNISVAVTGGPPPPPPPPPANLPPVLLMGGDQTDTLPKNSDTLTVQASDPNADPITLLWTQVGSTPNVATLAGTTTTSLRVSGMVAGTYQFRLTASDGRGGNTSGFSNILVVDTSTHVDPDPPPPTPPVYLAPTITSYGGTGLGDTTIQFTADSAYLRGRVTHKDTAIQSVHWYRLQASGVNPGTIVSPTDSVTKVTGLSPGTYQYYFSVTDKAGNITTTIDRPVFITILPIDVPVPQPMPQGNGQLRGSGLKLKAF